MATPSKYPDKHILKVEDYTMDFSAVTSLSLSNPQCTIRVASGIDAAPAAMLSGSPVLVGGIVKQRIQGGVVGVTYTLTFVVTAADGRVYPDTVDLTVVDRALG